MRIRQVKPEFWRDSVMAHMSDTVRLVYIGLWMEADDAGYLRLAVDEIARDLWDAPRATRERRLTAALADLEASGRVVRQECGTHAIIPTLTDHQRLAAPEKRVHTIQREHARECLSPQVPASPRVSPARNGKVREGNGKGRGGVGGDAAGVEDAAQEQGVTTSEFRLLVPDPRLPH
jgi:hypothetical protein